MCINLRFSTVKLSVETYFPNFLLIFPLLLTGIPKVWFDNNVFQICLSTKVAQTYSKTFAISKQIIFNIKQAWISFCRPSSPSPGRLNIKFLYSKKISRKTLFIQISLNLSFGKCFVDLLKKDFALCALLYDITLPPDLKPLYL